MTDQPADNTAPELHRVAEINPAAPKKIQIKERRVMALALRKQGASYRAIAANMRERPGVSPKYNPHAAYVDVMAALQELNEKQTELAKENQRLDLERLDAMFVNAYDNAKKGDVMSINACLSIMEKRAKLLGYNQQEAPRVLNFDASALTDEQLQRIANGEDPARVINSGTGR